MQSPLADFADKWAGRQNEPAAETLMQIDAQRIGRGKRPLDDELTYAAQQAATNRQPFTPMPERNPLSFWSNLTDDIGDLVRGIPRLPQAVIGSFQELREKGPFYVPEGGNIADTPLTRFLPGAFVASALLPGGEPADALLTRPATTALDILPFGQYAALGNAQRALGKIDDFPFLPEVNSAQTAKLLRERMLQVPDSLPLANRADRLGIQTAIARGEGRRVIPDLMSTRIIPTVEGTAEMAPRAWQTAAATNPITKPLMQFAPRVREFRSQMSGLESQQVVLARQSDLYKAGEDLTQRMRGEFEALNYDFPTQQRKLDRLVASLEDPGSLTDSGWNISREQGRDILKATDPELVKYHDEWIEKQLPALTEQQTTDMGLARKIDVYELDGQIYGQKELKTLRSKDSDFYKRQKKVTKALDDTVDVNIRRRLADKYDEQYLRMLDAGSMDTLRRMYGDDALQDATRFVRLRSHLSDLASLSVKELIDSRVATPPARINWNNMEIPDVIRSNDVKKITTATDEMARVMESRHRVHLSHRPANQMATGSRLWWDKYKEYFERSQQVIDPQDRITYRKFRRKYDLDRKDAAAKRDWHEVRRRFKEKYGDDYHLFRYIVPEDPDFIKYATEDFWRQNARKLIDEGEYDFIAKEVNASLARLADEGYNPVYVPRVPLEKAGQIDLSSVRASWMEPEYAKRRTYDYAPHHPDLGIAVSYTALMDYMSREAIPKMVEMIQTHPSLLPESRLDTMLQSEAQVLKDAGRLDRTVSQYVNDMKRGPNRRYVPYQPESIFPSVSPTSGNARQLWIPTELEAVLKASVQQSVNFSNFRKILEPTTGLFRTSVLLFAPGWHANNILGGLFQMALTNPAGLMRLPQQFNMMGGFQGMVDMMRQADPAQSGLEASLRGTGAPGEMFSRQMHEAGLPGVLGATEQIQLSKHAQHGDDFIKNVDSRAKTATRIWDQITGSNPASNFVRKFGAGSLGLNSFFDDLFRRASFEEFFDQRYTQLVDDYKGKFGEPSKEILDELHKEAATHGLTKMQD